MNGIENWSEMTWQERREERFKRWLSPPNVKFISPEAEKLYKQRTTRFIKAIKLEEPDRVPVLLPVGNYPAVYAGGNFRKVMYDYNALRESWIKFMDDFGDMDTFSGPGLIPSGRILEAIDTKTLKWPGHGLGEDVSMQQIVEGEYMKADEYDQWMRDPSDYIFRVILPRTAGLFESFRKLPPLRLLQGAVWVGVLADPGIRKTFETLLGLADEYRQWQAASAAVAKIAMAKGYPSFRGGGPFVGAPYDHFADLLRGTRGIVTDLYRQPEKLQAAMERQLELATAVIKNYPLTNCPLCMMPLHKGDDTFMSDKQFETFYWPTLRKVFLAMIDEGLVPMPFAEGIYTSRLKQIADTPKSGVVWYFDQTDMAEAKRILGNVCCIVGNVPTSLVITGTAQQVKERCRKLIETCAPGGGYVLAAGASIDKGNMENLHAMMDAAKEYGAYPQTISAT
jgi:uroporphyrinogen-III decarboxylase